MMVHLRGTARFFSPILLLLIFQSCAQTKNGPPPQVTTVAVPQEAAVQAQSQIKQPVAADDHQKRVQTPKAAAPTHAPSQVKQALAAGDYQKTINQYKAEYRKHPQDQALVKEYVKTLKEIKAAADESALGEDVASACKTYNILLKNYPDFKAFAHALSFDRTQLKAKTTNCKTALSKKGFQEYRQGNLTEAISLWQDCLAIDPNNADIKKALNTAKAQQKNLQQTK
jgi:tetratricopeptide (TPR) repeat protein